MTRIRLRYVNEFIDRHGKVRYYFRRLGSRSVRLPGLPGSIEFMDAYQAALATVSPPPPSSKHVIRGSLAEIVAGYFRSAAFANLSQSSQRLYRIAQSQLLRRMAIGLCASCRRLLLAMSSRRSASPARAWPT
jgi:hypothetical protein